MIELLPLPEGDAFNAQQMSEYAMANVLADRKAYWKHKSWSPPTLEQIEINRAYARSLKNGDIAPCAHCGKDMLPEDDFDDGVYTTNRHHDSYVIECNMCFAAMYGKTPQDCVEKWNRRAYRAY